MTAAAPDRSTEINYRDLLITSIKSTLIAFEHTCQLIEWADTVDADDAELVAPLIAPARRAVAALTALEDAALQIEAISPRREPVFDAYRRFTCDHPASRRRRPPG